jgi:hypothetical protein
MSTDKVDIRPLIQAGFTAKGLKTWDTHDGGGYQFNLYYAGKKVAQVTNEGNGGDTQINWSCISYSGKTIYPYQMDMSDTRKVKAIDKKADHQRAALEMLNIIVAATPPVPCNWGEGEKTLTIDAGWLMEEMVNHLQLVKQCRGKTMFTVPGMAKGEMSYYNEPLTDNMRAFMARKHPDATIINDTL